MWSVAVCIQVHLVGLREIACYPGLIVGSRQTRVCKPTRKTVSLTKTDRKSEVILNFFVKDIKVRLHIP